MSKVNTLIELLQEIAKGNIENGQRFNIYFDNGLYRECYYKRSEDGDETGGFDFIKNVSDDYDIYDSITLNEEVELIDNEENIDIQDIEELDIYEENVTKGNIIDKINDLVIAVKQLDKRMREEK